MSFEAMTWATKQDAGSAAAKLVLLMLANHANGHTGQCNPRIKNLAADCNMSERSCREQVRRLEELGLIRCEERFAEGIQLPNQYWLNLQEGGQILHPPPAGFAGTPLQDLHTIEPGRLTRNRTSCTNPAGFDAFWLAYPKKIGKGNAEKAFAKAAKATDLQTILTALETAKATDQWQRDGGQYIPHPATWLNQKRWEDEHAIKVDEAPGQMPLIPPERAALFRGGI